GIIANLKPSNTSPSGFFTINNFPSSGYLWVNGTNFPWTNLEVGGAYILGSHTAILSAATTSLELAVNAALVIDGAFPGVSAYAFGNQVFINSVSTGITITPNLSGTTGDITWQNSSDGTVAETLSTSNSIFTFSNGATAEVGTNTLFGTVTLGA